MSGIEESASSRIFVKGLPPTFTDAEFRKHFAREGEITDAKIFPNRRIGYIGYKTSQDAQNAVKYFNRTFIRMSRISVEIARPPPQAAKQPAPTPTARRDAGAYDTSVPHGGIKRKRDSETKAEDDPKLKEFLEAYKPKSKRKAWESDVPEAPTVPGEEAAEWDGITEGQSDGEYEVVPKKTKRAKPEEETAKAPSPAPETVEAAVTDTQPTDDGGAMQVDASAGAATTSDADWARSRTSRLLGLLDEDEEGLPSATGREESDDEDEESDLKITSKGAAPAEAASSLPSPPLELGGETAEDGDTAAKSSTSRLFVRNLPYNVKEEDLTAEFEPFGNLEEVHVCMDKKTGLGKGFAFVDFTDPETAERALAEKDGRTFQGRLLHILPGTAKRENKLDDFALSKLPLKKQQQIKRKREAASTTWNWNALYMNADAVASSIADRFGLAKSEVIDPTSSEAAVKQAHAETMIIKETKDYFLQQGVDLDSFKKFKLKDRGDTAFLVKNIPYEKRDELERLFAEQGEVKRFLMPPNGVIAIVEMANAAQCQTAYSALAYKRVGSSMLMLEKAPKDVFNGKRVVAKEANAEGVTKTSASDLKNADARYTVPDVTGTATLFVRNLNFTTTTDLLTQTFKPLSGFLSGRVKTKTDPKKPGQILSMGFGFLEFASARQAQAALKAMDGHTLEGHKLQIRASHKGADAAEDRRKSDAAKRVAGKKTKVIIKNLPFEATKKDVRSLFGAYGQLRSVRVPKKMDRGARGFAFADFTTPKEAENAMDALRDTHLLGRRLVLDFAEADAEDAEAEIEKMQKKVGKQVDKVALQNLTGGGRKKFTTEQEDE